MSVVCWLQRLQTLAQPTPARLPSRLLPPVPRPSSLFLPEAVKTRPGVWEACPATKGAKKLCAVSVLAAGASLEGQIATSLVL